MTALKIGFLLVEYQPIDVIGPMDVLKSSSKKYIADLESGFERPHVPKGLAARAGEFEYHHVGETLEPVRLSGNLTVLPTTTCDDCPPLDMLLVGGAAELSLSPRFARFVGDHVAAGRTLFTTCTGGAMVASTGILDGREATTNHEVVPLARTLFPRVRWTTEKQWVVDGNVWTAGGAVAGMDMMAHWVRVQYGDEVADAGLAALDFEPRDQRGELVLEPHHWKKVLDATSVGGADASA